MSVFQQACTFIKANNLTALQELFHSNNDSSILNMFDDQQETLLTLACLNASSDDHLDVIKFLLNQSNIDVNKSYHSSSGTPLYIACERGFQNLVKLLLSNSNIDINKGRGPNFENTPLLIACEKDYPEIVKDLLNHSTYFGKLDINKGDSPLFYACKNGNLELVKLLLSRNDINVNLGPLIFPQGSLGSPIGRNSPLSISLECNFIDIVKELSRNPNLTFDQKDIDLANRLGIDVNQFQTQDNQKSCIVM